MLFLRSDRSAVLGLALLGCLTPVAQAGGLFPWHHKDCCDTTVTVPAQRAIVEVPATRIARQETFQVGRGLVAPVFGAAYMPVAFPVMGVGVAGGGTAREVDLTAEDSSALRSVHAAEQAAVRHAKARALANVEVEAARRALERSVPPTEISRAAAPGDMDQRIKDLSDKLDKVADRLTAVERLTLTHENYIREQMQKKANMSPSK